MVELTPELGVGMFNLAMVTLALFVLRKYHKIFEVSISPSLLKGATLIALILWFGFVFDILDNVYSSFIAVPPDVLISLALVVWVYYMLDYLKGCIRSSLTPLKVLNGQSDLKGGVYLFTGPDVSSLFGLTAGKKVIALTRNPDPFRKMGVPYFWLSKVSGENTIDPLRLSAILQKLIERADENTVVVVDGLEYLILENGFNSVVKFLTALKDNLLLKGATFVVIADPGVLEPSQLAILKREFRELSPKQ